MANLWRLYGLLLLGAAAGCEQYRASERVSAAESQVAAGWIHPKCLPSLPPTARCGLVWDRMENPESEREFFRVVCEKLEPKECASKYLDTYFARLRETYYAADPDAPELWCRAHPVECRDPRKLEMQWLTSHNGRLASARDAQVEAIRAEEAAESRARRMRAAEALRQSFQPRPAINCTSQSIGSSTYTNCR